MCVKVTRWYANFAAERGFVLAEPPLSRMTQFLEIKTVWHPMGR